MLIVLRQLLELGLQDQILLTAKNSPTVGSRYIFYPDHLVRMPTPIPGAGLFQNIFSNGKVLFTEPVFKGFVQALVRESFKEPRENRFRDQDESVAEFVSRRSSPQIADNLVSALYHGIYAGDIERLSAQALLGPYWNLERTDRRVIGPLLNIINSGRRYFMMDDLLALHSIDHTRPQSHWQHLNQLARGSSVLTLRDGVGVISERLQKAIGDSEKAEILINTRPRTICRDRQTSGLTVRGTIITYRKAFS
jgi:protoporphyrinogen/coproporphyrinogen III oxidase